MMAIAPWLIPDEKPYHISDDCRIERYEAPEQPKNKDFGYRYFGEVNE